MYIFIYQKLDNWIMQFKSFHWLTHYGLWVIIPYACIKTSYTGSVFVHRNIQFLLAKYSWEDWFIYVPGRFWI